MRDMWTSRRTGRRRRGTTVLELRSVLEQGVTAKAISEPLFCVSGTAEADGVAKRLRELDFDVAGIAEDEGAPVDGYILQEDLQAGLCAAHARSFRETDLISDSLTDVLAALRGATHRFVLNGSRIDAIVTRADLQKPPVRVVVFGLITLLEMNLSRLVRDLYPNRAWVDALSAGRCKAAHDLMEQRRARNEELDLLDCLQFCDKRDLLKKNKAARDILGFPSKKKTESRLGEIEALRDRIAHAQDLVSGSSWEAIVDAIRDAESMIRRCEDHSPATARGV